MHRSLALASLLLALPAPAMAQSIDPQPEASPAPTAPKDNPEKVICKQEKQTGSRVASRKVCLTERQWRERSAQAQEDVGRRLRTGNGDN